MLSVNLDAMFLMTKAFGGGMRRCGWGRIINMASDTVSLVVPGFTHYIAGGSRAHPRARHRDWPGRHHCQCQSRLGRRARRAPKAANKFSAECHRRNFRIVASMQAIKRVETVADLVGVVSFLVSDAVFVTGLTIFVNGGLVRV
jgi:NAD(P)-dependent dehydrogenase (short-subunit alcohol dehydrogenase family)